MEPCILGPEDGLEVMAGVVGNGDGFELSSLAVQQAHQRCGKERHTVRREAGVEERAEDSLYSPLLMALLFHNALSLSRAVSFDESSLLFFYFEQLLNS